jgi:predicted permease
MSPLRWLQLLAFSEFLSALCLPGAYTFPFRTLDAVNKFTLSSIFGDVISISLIAVPTITLVALLKGKKIGLWGLYLSPLLLFAFGLGAIPLLANLAPVGTERTFMAALLNISAFIAAIYFGRKVNWEAVNA